MKAHGLAEMGHEMHVISHSLDHSRHEYWDGPVQVIRIPSFDKHLPIYTEPVRWLTYSVEVAVALSELNARSPLDLVDFPEWGSEGYVHLLNQTKWNRIPSVIQLHGPLVMLANTIGWPERGSDFYRIGVQMEETCLRHANAVFSSSRCSATWCAKYYGLALDQIPIQHAGVDTNVFQPLDLPKEIRPTVIFVGKIVKNKGADLLLEAALRLKKGYPSIRLQMIGHGDQELMSKMKERARGFGSPEVLNFVGFVQRQDIAKYLSRAHFFVAPSLYEGGPGFVYLEAMACGLPVIACEGSGAAEVVVPGENGLLVPPGDVTALVKAMNQLLSNPQECLEMGKRARNYVLREADSKVCLARIEKLYKTFIASS